RSRFAKVGARGVGDAVGAAPVVDGVEVGGEDLVLGPLPGHLGGDDQLAHLAADRALGADERVLHVLLGDGGAAARVLPAEQVVAGRAQEAGGGETGIGVEAAILRSEERRVGKSVERGGGGSTNKENAAE